MLDVLCIGEALVDLVASRRGPLGAAPEFRRYAGGAPANVARGVARLGARAGWMWSIGEDAFGDFVLSTMAAEGIDVSRAVRTRRGKTELAFVALDAEGNPHFDGYGFPGASRCYDEAWVDAAYVGSAHIAHFGSNTLMDEPPRRATLAAMAAARDAGRLVSFDANLRLHLWDTAARATATVRQLLPGVDVLKVSIEEARLLTGDSHPEDAARRLRGWQVGLAVVTLGAEGCAYAAAHHEGVVAGAPAAVVDATGAGDSFVAGLLCALLPHVEEGRAPTDLPRADLEEALQAANRAGAAAVGCEGAVEWRAEEIRPRPR
jgi:fructokinase